jgi:hypothetical protein
LASRSASMYLCVVRRFGVRPAPESPGARLTRQSGEVRGCCSLLLTKGFPVSCVFAIVCDIVEKNAAHSRGIAHHSAPSSKFRSGFCARSRSWRAGLAASSGAAAPAVERRWRSRVNLLKHQTASPGQASLASGGSPAGPSHYRTLSGPSSSTCADRITRHLSQ